MRAELGAYLSWYHGERPHQGLGGLTPAERLRGEKAARKERPLEPRRHMPIEQRKRRRVNGTLEIRLVREVGAAKLPLFALHQAA